MRVLKLLPLVSVTVSVWVQAGPGAPASRGRGPAHSAGRTGAVQSARPGPRDLLWAADGDANYAYGPSRIERRALSASAAATAAIQLTPDSDIQSNGAALAAFTAAADIWAHTVVSSVPIRVTASFHDMGNPNILGSAGPTVVCSRSGTYYAAALADSLLGSQQCASLGGASAEIDAEFNSTFDWDFGTSGTPVPGKINFMTVVLHELGHGLGFFGSMDATSGSGTFLGSFWTPPITYDRFAVTGAGARLLDFGSPSQALAAQLVSDNTFFDGTAARAGNGGSRPKLETHHFTNAFGAASDNGFLRGSSYSHIDDVLYSPDGSGAARPNGLMTWRLQRAEVYTDPGPIMRGMFQDMGWTLATATPCSYSISPTGYAAPSTATSVTVTITTLPGCTWTAVSQASFISIASPPGGGGSGNVTVTVAANSGTARVGTVLIAGQTFTVNQASPCAYGLSATSLSIPSAALTSSVSVQTVAGCSWTATSLSGFLTITNGAAGTGNGTVTFRVAANTSVLPRTGSLAIAGQTFTVAQGGLGRTPDVDGDGQADLTVFRPTSGEWFARRSTSNYSDSLSLLWGLPGDRPLAADFDGDGRMDLTVYRPSTGQWFIRYSSQSYNAFDTYQWGLSADLPLVADFDGDGRSDLVVYRPSTGEWFIRQSSANYSDAFIFQWGLPGDQPIATDFDGDRRTDLVVYRPSTGEWFIRFSSTGFAYETAASYAWGLPSDVPIAADFDGDRKTDLAVFRPSNCTWYIRYSTTAFSFATWTSFQWGLPGDVPIVADFDGDGRADLVVYRPTTGDWFIRYSASGYSLESYRLYQWGIPGDVPLIPGKR